MPINQTGDVLKRRPISTLAAQAETADQRLITRFVNALDIVKKATTLRNQLQKAATRMIVILVALEVFGEVGDTLGKNGNLYFRRTGVAFLGGVFLDKCLLALSSIDIVTPFLDERKTRRPGRDVVQRGPFTRSDMLLRMIDEGHIVQKWQECQSQFDLPPHRDLSASVSPL
jgi:hypothetical protein